MSSILMVNQNVIKLQCFASGNPAPDITWYKDGEIVHGEVNLYEAPEERLLHTTIRNPNCTHIGKYVCKAENKHGTVNDTEKSVTGEGNKVEHYIIYVF